MTKTPKIIKAKDRPVNPDVWRLAESLTALLKRRYPNPDERREAARQIVQRVVQA